VYINAEKEKKKMELIKGYLGYFGAKRVNPQYKFTLLVNLKKSG